MKLSGLQIFWLMFTYQTGNIILLTIGPVLEEAKQDVWISYLIASVLGVLIVYVAVKTASLYPKHTLIQYSKHILGKWLGTIVTLAFIVQYFKGIRRLYDFNTPSFYTNLGLFYYDASFADIYNFHRWNRRNWKVRRGFWSHYHIFRSDTDGFFNKRI